jgi:membrane protein
MNIDRLRRSLPGRLVTKLQADQAPNWALIIAWNALFSLFPMVLVAAAVLGLVLGWIGVGSSTVYSTVLSVIPNDNKARADALSALSTFHQKDGIFFVVGFAGLLWAGGALFNAMQAAFVVIYRTRPRALARQFLVSLGMVLAFTVLAGAIVCTSALLSIVDQLPFLPAALHHAYVALPLQFGLGAAAGWLLFLLIYWVVPNRRRRWPEVWPGALLAGVLFEVLTLLFPTYLRLTGSSDAYGKTFGLMFMLLTFAYFFGLITILGAELNSLLEPAAEVQRGRRRRVA